ncbi:MAG: 30S ribosomal protein S4 [Candidatus Omnitrophica bacterium]|nr:30S ribosomal protein S4 [Candidatus Omnitrophota bacterium]
MGRNLGSLCKICRRAGMKLFLKGLRCSTEKCAFAKRPYPPGMHGKLQQTKESYYALQLREKQKVKSMYGLLERQFRRFFSLASHSKGATGRVLIQLLERRLDNVIYRALLTFSRLQARQFVRHGFVFKGNRRIDIPSYLVNEGEVFEIRAKDSIIKMIKDNIDINSKERSVPQWLTVDKSNLKIEIIKLPQREDLGLPINEQLIVELYSK